MAELLIVAFVVAFLFGLVQWARSGAVLWDILKFSGNRTADPEDPDEETRRGRIREKEKIRELESMTDRLLRSSFRVLGILALCVWIFIIATVIFDMLGLDWMDRLSFQANRFWGDPASRSGIYNSQSGPSRNTILRSIGSGLRR